MLPQTAGRLVGLITIEELPLWRSAATQADREDATLSQIMARLAAKSGVSREVFETGPGHWPNPMTPSRLTAGQFAPAAPALLAESEWIVADLERLTADLELAAAQARSEIATARQAGG
jgi:hypothetical protein